MTRILTPREIVLARELDGVGFDAARVAELMGVDSVSVVVALERLADLDGRGSDRAPVETGVQTTVDRVTVPRSVGGWAPPADESTVWSAVRVRGWPDSEDVKVREVLLWGQVVRVNEAGEVWCHACASFKTVSQLGHPDNRCPVGIIRPSGTVMRMTEAEMLADCAASPPGGFWDSFWSRRV